MNNYFSHDSNARNSDKLIPLRSEMGAEGYGIYFMLLERLREEPDYTSVKDYNMLAFDLRVDAAKIKRVIEGFRLFVFTEDGKYFYSEGFRKRMNYKDEKSEKARQSALLRWAKKQETSERNANAADNLCERNANAQKNDAIKESKVKKSKEKKNKFFSQCAPAGCPPLSAEEKEKIFEIFFFSNLQNPEGELSAYIDHNTALGWMCGSNPISDKVAYAKGWVKKKTEKEANVPLRFPTPFLAQYRLFCDVLRADRIDLPAMFLHGLYGLKIEQKKLMLICSAEMAKTLKTDDKVRRAFTENVLAGKFAGYDLSCVKPTIGQTER